MLLTRTALVVVLATFAAIGACGRSEAELVHCQGTDTTRGSWSVALAREPIDHRFVLLWDGYANIRLDLDSGAVKRVNDDDGLIGCDLAGAKPRVAISGEDHPLSVWDWSSEPPRPVLQSSFTRVVAPAFSPSGDRLAFVQVSDDERKPDLIIVWNLDQDRAEAEVPDTDEGHKILWRDEGHFLLKTGARTYNMVSRTSEGWEVTDRPAIEDAPSRLHECFVGEQLLFQARDTLRLPGTLHILGCEVMDAIRLDTTHFLVVCDTLAAIYTVDRQVSTFRAHDEMTTLAVRATSGGWHLVYEAQQSIWRVPVDAGFEWGEPERVAELPDEIKLRKRRASP